MNNTKNDNIKESKLNFPDILINKISGEISEAKEQIKEGYFDRIKSEYACLGIILFALALFGAVINIPCFLSLEAESIFLKIIWRFFVLVIILLPKAFYDLSLNLDNLGKIFSSKNLLDLFFLSILNTIWVYMFYYAASHTFAAHTLLLQIPLMFLCIWKLLRRESTTYLEIIGLATCILGSYLISNDGATLDRRDIIIGNIISLSSSILGAVYIKKSSHIIDKEIPSSIFLSLMGIFVIVFSFIFASFLGENIVLGSANPKTGIFGLFSSKANFIYGFLGMGFMSGFALYFLSIKASQYISPMFVNTTFNTAPFLSQVTCYIVGVQGFPGSFTAYGGFWLFIGCTLLAMNYEDHKDMSTKFPLYYNLEENHDEKEMKVMLKNVN